MTELHKNNNYKVVLVPVVDVDNDLPYHVINLEHDVVEYETEVLPQALLISEQFNQMLESGSHLQYRQNFTPVNDVESPDNVTPILS